MADFISGKPSSRLQFLSKLGCLALSGLAVGGVSLFLFFTHKEPPKNFIPLTSIKIGRFHYCFTQVNFDKPVWYALDLSQQGTSLRGLVNVLGGSVSSITGSFDEKNNIQFQMVQIMSKGLLGFDIPYLNQTESTKYNLIGHFRFTNSGETRMDGFSVLVPTEGQEQPPAGEFHCSSTRPQGFGK